MSYLDDLKGKTVSVNGTQMPDRKRLEITAPGAVASDSPASNATVLDLTSITFTDSTSGGGNPVMQVAPNQATPISLSTSVGAVNVDADPGADGVFRFSLMLTVKDTSGNYRTDDYVVIGVRSAGVMTLLGTPKQLDIGGDTTNVATTITANAGGFRAAISSTVDATGYVWCGWAKGDLI